MLKLNKITKDNQKLCIIVKQEPFRIKYLLLLLTRRLLMPSSSLSPPAPARVIKVKCIALCKFWLLIYQFPETHSEKRQLKSIIKHVSVWLFWRLTWKSFRLWPRLIFCVLCLNLLKNGVIAYYYCSKDMRE